ncbi:MAG: hypothetical protein AAFV25_26335 [Bacteroidota bacterium]
MKTLFTLLLSCWTILALQAAINPLYKECAQRGYSINGDYCIFPDSSQCLLEEFNEQKCGQKWFTENYCVEEGQYVWDEDRCCNGLVAYLPPGVAGQARCVPKHKAVQDQLMGGDSRWYGLLIALLLGALVVLRFQQNRRKKS